MKRTLLTATTFLLILALLTGCSQPQAEQPGVTESSSSTTAPTATPAAMPSTEAEADVAYEDDASSDSTDVVYTHQIEQYYTAVSQQWDESIYWDHEMSSLAVFYYDGTALDNVGFTFMDLDGNGIQELIIGAILGADRDPLVFEIWTVRNGEPFMLAQSGSHNRYYLQYAEEDDLWTVAYEAENGAANRAVYYLHLADGEFHVIQGIVFDALASENNPWFMAYDLDWDVSNDTPIDENTAIAVMQAGRNIYAAQTYLPYSQYK